jgi:hypothetical protein
MAQETWWVTELAGTMWNRRYGWFQSLLEKCGTGDMVGSRVCWNNVAQETWLVPELAGT